MEHGLVMVATPDEVTQAELDSSLDKERREQAVRDAFASDLYSRWQGYREARREVEDEWLDALRAVKGEYGPEQEKVMEQQQALSRVFIKITATKVNAAYSRLIDLLFQNVDSFWDIVPSPLSDIPAAIKQQIRMMAIQELLPYRLDPRTRNQLIQERNDEMERELMAEALEKANTAAMKMKRLIKDYLINANALTEIKKMVREQVTLGTGCIKVATLNIRNHEKWESEGDEWKLNEHQSIEPDIEWASVFDLFPDPYSHDPGKPNDLFRRHVLTKHEFRELAGSPGFEQDTIHAILMESPQGNHVPEDYERELRNINNNDEQYVTPQRFDVLEYWGPVDGQQLMEYGVTDIDEQAEYQANIWICDGRMIMARLNPLKPEAIPYKFVPYESVLHRFWGIGIPYMMNDSQDVMNSTGRALLDNAALTAGPMFQMDVSKFPEGMSLEDAKKIYPYRLWFYDGEAGEGPMIQAINIQSNQKDLSGIFEMFRRFADEETSLPSYTHGEQTQSLNKTASGMSMLMTAANVALKSAVKNIDDYATVPLIDSLFNFAMRWSDSEDAKRGDLDVVAMGSASLVAKELQSERMMNALNVSMNPVLGPMTDHRYLYNEYLKSLDIDPDKALRPEEELYAQSHAPEAAGGGSRSDGEQSSGVRSGGGVSSAPTQVAAGETGNVPGFNQFARPAG
ncbi:portal protein [Endozoicomonas sp. ALB115]|uniref:portal protein n=1 Tax=Endozoicomonas sp. ALB115 TaxID=3403074 RepID=UPI003BB6C87C